MSHSATPALKITLVMISDRSLPEYFYTLPRHNLAGTHATVATTAANCQDSESLQLSTEQLSDATQECAVTGTLTK